MTAAAAAWARGEQDDLTALIGAQDERARRADDPGVHREAVEEARRLRRARLRLVADRRDATGDLAARLDAVAAGYKRTCSTS